MVAAPEDAIAAPRRCDLGLLRALAGAALAGMVSWATLAGLARWTGGDRIGDAVALLAGGGLVAGWYLTATRALGLAETGEVVRIGRDWLACAHHQRG